MGRSYKRNVLCKDYGGCLDRAVMTGQTLNCEGCEFEHDRDDKNETTDFFSYCLLFVAVFFPKVYRAYRKYRRNDGEEARTELETLIEEIRQAKEKGILRKLIDRETSLSKPNDGRSGKG